MVDVLRRSRHMAHCTATEALYFLRLVELPFTDLTAVAGLFPVSEFYAALQPYLPASPGSLLEQEVGVSCFCNSHNDAQEAPRLSS